MQATRRTLLAALMVALAVALGFALAGIPNVELMTATVFVAGYLLGVAWGAGVGAVAMALHSILNPLGAALPPLLAGQVVAFAVVGVAGALAGPVIERTRHRPIAFLLAAVTGFVITLLFDVMTNVGAFYSITGERGVRLTGFIMGGVAFTAMHLVWNTGLFFIVIKPVLSVLERYRAEIR